MRGACVRGCVSLCTCDHHTIYKANVPDFYV